MSWTVARAKLAASTRHHPDAATDELRRDLRAERMADLIARGLAQSPPLTLDQRAAMAALLLADGRVAA